MKVIKRDGTKEEFNIEKIVKAILKAFNACKIVPTKDNLRDIKEFSLIILNHPDISVEKIQDEVEKFLVNKGYFAVAKAYMLYREEHKQARLTKEKLNYIHKYSESQDSATNLSNTDDNANASKKNAATLEGELYKNTSRIIQRSQMKELLAEINSPYRDQYIKDLENHIFYQHDESSPILKPYCSAYTLYPLLVDGTNNIDGTKNHAPKHLSSFVGQFQNLVFLLSAQKKGAGAYGEFFNFFSYFCEKEWGEKYYEKADVVITNEHCLEQRTIGQTIDQYFQSVTHYINQPAGNRGYQCVREDTELWTPAGFKQFSELKVGDECYVYDKETGKFKVETIQQLNIYDFDGDLLRFSSRDYQQTVTPNHRVLNYKTNSKELRLIDAQDLFGKTAIRVPTTGILDVSDYPISDAGIKIIATLYTDGSFEYAKGHGDARSRFGMSVNRNGLGILKSALKEENIEYNEHRYISRISGTELSQISPAKENMRKYNQFVNYDRNILSEELFKFSKRQLDIFFNTWANIDGQVRNKNNNSYMLQCDNDCIADQLQRLATQAGYNSKIKFVYRRANGVFKESYTRYVVLYGKDKRTITKYEKVPYKGKVWCPTTNAGVVVFREKENLMPYITGNSPFTNFNVFDSYYWHTMFDDFSFPDGTKPRWDAVNWLQKRYMKWLNEERTKTLLTFPVMTVCLLTDGNDVLDKEYKDFVTTQWAEGDSFFVYLSENVDSISSCCFSKNTKVLWKNSYDGVKCTTFEELHNLKYAPYKQNLKVYHNGSWINAKSVKLPNRKMFKVKTQNNKEFILSDNHINLTYRGEVHTSDLTTDDYLMFNTKPLEAVKENDEHLTYEQGMLVGMFIGDGSFETYVCEDGSVHNFCLSLNKEKFDKALPYLSKICEVQLSTPYNNVYPVRIHSKELVAFLMKWTGNTPGNTYAYNKKLNINCILQSKDFRQGILDGWYLTDGGNSNRCYTVSKDLVESMEILLISLGKQCVIDISDRTEEAVIIRGEEFNRNYPLYCIRWYSDTNARVRPESGFKWKNNSIYWKISSIEEIEYTDDIYCFEVKNQDEPYFTLPSGLITHNCRLRNEITENTFSSTTGLTGVQTGSCNVMTLNLNRIIQDWWNQYHSNPVPMDTIESITSITNAEHLQKYLENILDRIYDYQKAYKTGLYKYAKQGMFPQVNAGYISFDKLYCTIGVNGLNEAARFLGLEVSNNQEYMEFASWILGVIKEYNKKNSTKKFMFNLELVPAESLGVKNYNWDKKDKYWVPEDENLYNSYIYNAHDDTSVLDKIAMQGGKIAKSIDGGQASHINLQDNLDKEQYTKLLEYAVQQGNSYITFNVPQTQCDKCGFIAKHPFNVCPECGSNEVTQWTRIIGYLRPVKAWSEARQEEQKKRTYSKEI